MIKKIEESSQEWEGRKERCDARSFLVFGIRLGSDNWTVADQIIGNKKSHMGAVTT